MNRLLQDARYALRQMRNHPGFTAVIILTLALGIGANTATFTLTHAVMLSHLPVAKPDQLYRLGDKPVCCVQSGLPYLPHDWGLFSYSLSHQFQAHILGCKELAAFQAGETSLSIRENGYDPPEHAAGEFVSGNYFSMFGIQAAAGRNISPADDRSEVQPVAMMSYRFWQATRRPRPVNPRLRG
jgi:hypothetical protein